jgi:hypothetical protein
MNQRLNFRQKIVVAILDIVVLAELTYSIWQGSLHPEHTALTFMGIYIPVVTVTLGIGWLFIKKFRSAETEDGLQCKESQEKCVPKPGLGNEG